MERLLTARELAEIVGFQARTIVEWVEHGELPAFKIGGRLRFRESEVVAWLEARRAEGSGDEEKLSATPRARPTQGVVSQVSVTPLGRGGLEDAC